MCAPFFHYCLSQTESGLYWGLLHVDIETEKMAQESFLLMIKVFQTAQTKLIKSIEDQLRPILEDDLRNFYTIKVRVYVRTY